MPTKPTKPKRIRNRHFVQPCDRDPLAWAAKWLAKADGLDYAARYAADDRQAEQLHDQADEWRRMARDLLERHAVIAEGRPA